MNNTYRLTLEIGGLVSLVGSAGGSQRRQNTTASTDVGGSPAHSHGYFYREYLDGTNPGFELQPVLWVKNGASPIAIHSGAESSDAGFAPQSFPVFTQKGSGLIRWSYHQSTVATLYDDSRFSIKLTIPNLWLLRAEIDRWRLTVTPLFQHDGYLT